MASDMTEIENIKVLKSSKLKEYLVSKLCPVFWFVVLTLTSCIFIRQNVFPQRQIMLGLHAVLVSLYSLFNDRMLFCTIWNFPCPWIHYPMHTPQRADLMIWKLTSSKQTWCFDSFSFLFFTTFMERCRGTKCYYCKHLWQNFYCQCKDVSMIPTAGEKKNIVAHFINRF